MDKALEQRSTATLRNHLVTLPFDLKVLYEAKDDPNFERAVRETVCGAILYILHPQESNERILGRSDDVVLLRLVLGWVRAQGGADDFCARFGEIYGTLDEDLATYKSALGATYPWLDGIWNAYQVAMILAGHWEARTFVSEPARNFRLGTVTGWQPLDASLPDGAEDLGIREAGWDHEHCDICYARIHRDAPQGYVDPDDHWLCPACHDRYAVGRDLSFVIEV